MKPLADLRTLRSFVTVAREGNVSRAAERLHLTQPAVSLQLKRLAEEAGLELFRRTAKGLDLTPDGELLLKKAEQVLKAVEELGQTARRMTGSVRGTLRIGTIIDPDFIRLGSFLAGLLEAAPELRTELVQGMSGDVPVRLDRGEIDAGFMLEDPGAVQGTAFGGSALATDLLFRPLTSFAYRILAPAGWQRRTAGLDWAGLARLPWIGTPPRSIHSRLLERRFEEAGVVQNRVALVDQEPSMLAMVRSGVGLSLCREAIALHENQVRGLTIVGEHRLPATLGFSMATSRMEEPSLALALQTLERVWASEF
ncbi:LysR family transcriptional regulator [Limimaricola variabilis]|uniref:LysR family transcriptional regulator n=1 Tax=Limimaricola variabilis TaxID=1492771 RepID=UPI002AC95557|nr:LysR family transcriptional regulator [Limimaricola variabilis]WPY93238.1 LysR family transcriptional regulator [Limimaricola variabilis]